MSPTSVLTLGSQRQRRLEADREVLAEVFPELRHVIDVSAGEAVATGPIRLDVGAGYFEEIEIKIEFGREYPRRPYRVFDAGDRWTPNPDRHIQIDGSFCLWLDGVDEPDLSSASQFRESLLRLALFLYDQFRFDDLGEWPEADWKHGYEGYAQFAIETLNTPGESTFELLWPFVMGRAIHPRENCPCGSRQRYSRCHRHRVESIRWLSSLDAPDQILTFARKLLPHGK